MIRVLAAKAAAAVIALAALAAASLPRAAAAPPDLTVPPGHGGDLDCSACHTAEGWDRVVFEHATRTGFALDGRHATAACRGCHVTGDFRAPLPRACSACHRDVHAGRLGARCERCHRPDAWRSATLAAADAHRRTNFPLVGRHGVIPCEECHGDRRDRAFGRPTVQCKACHEQDLARTAGSGVPHDGFPPACQLCHGPWRFSPAGFAGHDACWPLHHGGATGCLVCHVTFAGMNFSVPIQCTGSTCLQGCQINCHRSCTGDGGGGGLRVRRPSR